MERIVFYSKEVEAKSHNLIKAEKLLNNSSSEQNFTHNDFLKFYELILKNITILGHSIAGKKNYQKAFELCEDVDLGDIPFVVFSLYLKYKFNGFDKIVTTNDLFDDF